MNDPVTIHVCSDDHTETIGTAQIVESYLLDDDPAIILRGVTFNAEQILSGQIRALQHDVAYYEGARDRALEAASNPTGRAITEAEWVTATSNLGAKEADGFFLGLEFAGIAIIPNPAPSNYERLANVYRDWHGGNEVPASLIRFMDEAGVTAPEEK